MMQASDWILFIGAALLMVLTPGPNMVYLISRTLCQGRGAGVISLLGVIVGFLAHMFAAAAGLTALFIAVLVWLRHHENIRRLLKGQEPRIGRKKEGG